MSRRTLSRSGMGWGTHVEVLDGSGDPWGGSGWVGVPTRKFRTGRGP